jgi:hypothetical protein
MVSYTTSRNPNHSTKKSPGRRSGGARPAARQSANGWLMPPGTALTCSCCRGVLVEWETVQQAARRLPRRPFWQADTRRIMVRCTSCRHFHDVFTYRLFNWIPPRRLTTEIALLNILVAVLVICAMLPHHSMAALLPV